ncbi:MAG: flavoprotein, partial [Burkholderiales bacterium]|nr:flavoprotein [Burkholderiales bacterium]
RLELQADFRTVAVRSEGGALVVEGIGPDGAPRRIEGVDEIVVAAGGRPDLAIASELRLKLDHWIEATEQLAPLIDPNVHSCGTVRPHGHRELAHPEARFYAIGAKSYGRATNFLLATGHEQIRSVAAALAGDVAAADEVHLVLPETGVCSTQFDEASSGCCGGPPKKLASACCVKDEVAKEAGKSGCGCGPGASKEKQGTATRCA